MSLVMPNGLQPLRGLTETVAPSLSDPLDAQCRKLGSVGGASSCLGHLGRYETPKRLRFVTELPRGPSGKVQCLKLLDLPD